MSGCSQGEASKNYNLILSDGKYKRKFIYSTKELESAEFNFRLHGLIPAKSNNLLTINLSEWNIFRLDNNLERLEKMARF